MSDKEQNIENFFKKRLGQKDFPFREEDWMLMEARLDASVVSTGGGSSFVGLKGVVLVTVLTIAAFLSGWFLNEHFDSLESKNGEVGTVTRPKDSDPSALQMDSHATEERESKPKLQSQTQSAESNDKLPGREELSDRNGEPSTSNTAGIGGEGGAEQREPSSQQGRVNEAAKASFDADESKASIGNKEMGQALQ
ncbi:MAG: hypothetical protein RIE59_13515, partial [Imperialibacter sp.]